MSELKSSITVKYIRISPSKINLILKKIRGKTYTQALLLLRKIPRKSTAVIWKALSTVADQLSNQKIDLSSEKSLDKGNFIIGTAFVNRGPILKRMQPRAKGRAYRIEKIFSHLTLTLHDKKLTTNTIKNN